MKTRRINKITKQRLAVMLALATVLLLMLLGHGFAGNLEHGVGTWEVPSGQPTQMQSQVDYDPKLIDPFFKSNKWSYPWYIIKHPDGHFEDTSGGKSSKKEPPRLKHTANCFSTSFGGRAHQVRFCEAKLLDVNMVDLLIHDTRAAYLDKLDVHIRNGMFTCQYSTIYPGDPQNIGLIFTTKTQKLTLDKKVYRKGEVIKGRIDFECVQEIGNPKYVEKWGRNPTTIKVYGVFKTILE